MGRFHLAVTSVGRLHGTPSPPPTSSIIPALRGRGLCPQKEHSGDLGGVTWDILCYFLSVKCSVISSRGAPTIGHGRDPTCLSSQMAPGKHVLQSSGARPWESKPVPDAGPSLPRAPLHPLQGSRATSLAESSSQPLQGLEAHHGPCEHVLRFFVEQHHWTLGPSPHTSSEVGLPTW